MDATTLKKFRDSLIARRNEIESLRAMSAGARGAVELDQTSVGRVSRIDALQAQQMALAQERQREAELTRISAAMKRIDDGDYGYCLKCGEEIALKRLAFDPSVATCIKCAR